MLIKKGARPATVMLAVVSASFIWAQSAPEARAATPSAQNGATAKGVRAFRAQDYAGAKPLLEQGAQSGSPSAMRTLGDLYRVGLGVEQNGPLAMKWYEAAAQRGDVEAMGDIGRLYLKGWSGIQRDSTLGLRWVAEAASRGDQPSINLIGNEYLNGSDGLKADGCEALAWFRKGAAAGGGEATDNVGRMYERGACVTMSLDQARQYYKKAAAMGDETAKTDLADLANLERPVQTSDSDGVPNFKGENKQDVGDCLVNVGQPYTVTTTYEHSSRETDVHTEYGTRYENTCSYPVSFDVTDPSSWTLAKLRKTLKPGGLYIPSGLDDTWLSTIFTSLRKGTK